MVSRTEVQSSSVGDVVKLGLAMLLLCAAVVAYYYYSEVSFLYRLLGLLAVVGVDLFIVAQSAVGKRFLAFLGDARVEVRKVVWPTRQQTTQITLVVMVLMGILAVFLWLLDLLLAWGFQWLTGIGG